jgi:hypothetical protein
MINLSKLKEYLETNSFYDYIDYEFYISKHMRKINNYLSEDGFLDDDMLDDKDDDMIFEDNILEEDDIMLENI